MLIREAMSKSGRTPQTLQAEEELRKAVQSLLPDGFSLADHTTEAERRIDGYVDDIARSGKPAMEKVARLLRTIAAARS